MEQHTERIKCPECGTIQLANVMDTTLWLVYLHDCEKCKYIIMESEWEVVEKPKTKFVK